MMRNAAIYVSRIDHYDEEYFAQVKGDRRFVVKLRVKFMNLFQRKK